MRVPVEIIGDSYADDVSNFSVQETINLVPEMAERKGTRSMVKMSRSDGLEAFGTIGTGTIRGGREMDGVAYVVADTSLYSVASDGTETSLGSVTGSGRAALTNNETQLLVVNGVAGAGWSYTPGTSTFAAIADADFPGGDTATYLDGYAIVNVPDSDEYAISALDDVTSWAALDRKVCESATDGLKGVVADHGELLCLGGKTIEVHKNTGALNFPFERLTTIERGVASSHAWAQTDNGFFFLGDDGAFYRLNQWTPVRVSTRPIEQWIETETRAEAFCLAWSRKGHSFVDLTFPGGKTYVYDTATGLWHRRKSFGVERWRANTYLYAYNKHLIGDTTNGTLWEMSGDVYTEGSDPLVCERKSQFINADGQWVSMEEFEPLINAGQGLATGQGSDPMLDLCYSDDGGHTWSNWRQAGVGAVGQYGKRCRYQGLGGFNQSRAMWLRYSEPTRFDLMGAVADLS